jgi:hypothetical protein
MKDDPDMHLDLEIAFDLMEMRLEKALHEQWTNHLTSCVQCAEQMERFRTLRMSLKRAHLQNAPEFLLQSAVELFQPPAQTEQRSGVRQIIASLFFDSYAQAAPAGARGETATRQVVFRAEEFDIHVRIWESGQNRELLGQIQSRASSEFVKQARLHLLRDGDRVSSAPSNDLGEFRFSFVPSGSLSLQIDLPNLTVIGALDMKERLHRNQ